MKNWMGSLLFYGPDLLKTAIFNKSKEIVKKFQKNVKFDLQTHINMENKMNGSDRPLKF